MPKSNQAKKNLPKRTVNDGRKIRRAAAWERSQKRKERRRNEQAMRERRNDERRANGELTPYEAAKQRAAARRASQKQVKPGLSRTERRWTFNRAVRRLRQVARSRDGA